jgi:hypothetical protein
MAQLIFYTPCCFPVNFPFYSPLLTWKSSFDVKQPCPPWSQVARKQTFPFSFSPHPLPFQIPSISGQLCALLRRHCDPGFSWSGTIHVLKIFLESDFEFAEICNYQEVSQQKSTAPEHRGEQFRWTLYCERQNEHSQMSKMLKRP